MKIKKGKGIRRTVWMTKEFDEKSENARKRLGMSISTFIRFCVGKIVLDLEKEPEKQ